MKDFQKISSNSKFHNDWVDLENSIIEIEKQWDWLDGTKKIDYELSFIMKY